MARSHSHPTSTNLHYNNHSLTIFKVSERSYNTCEKKKEEGIGVPRTGMHLMLIIG